MIQQIAVLDACVLYSASLRDLFMWLAMAGIYFPKWTEQIHEEWIGNVLKNRPDISRERLERTQELMNLHAEGSLVEKYSPLISTLSLPDANDRHVLAAAIVSNASVIVTFNLSDFPKDTLAAYKIEVQHPDMFLSDLFDAAPQIFSTTLIEMICQLKNPPRTLEQYIDGLSTQCLKDIAQRLRTHSTSSY